MNQSISVRLEPDIRQRLDAMSSKSGVKSAQLIRLAIKEYCERVERTGQLVIDLSSSSRAYDLDDVDEDPHVRAAMDAGTKRGYAKVAEILKAREAAQAAARQESKRA